MEEQFNGEAKDRWRFAANAGRIADETTGSEDRKHTSGGFFLAVDSNLGAVVEAEEGAIESIPGNKGRIAHAWANVRGGLRIFSVYFWHSVGWTPRSEALLEAVLKHARTTRHLWLIARGANMCPEDFEKSLWIEREMMHVVAPKGAFTCRSQKMCGSKERLILLLRVVVSKEKSHRWRWLKILSQYHIKQCPLVRREKEIKEWNEQKLPSGKLARTEDKRARKRRRSCRRGRRIKKDQGSNRPRGECACW